MERMTVTSRIEWLNGLPTLAVDGTPFFVLGAQCDIWRSTRQDELTEAFFTAYSSMHASAVGIGVPWSRCEPEKDMYDFKFLDWFIQRAQEQGLRLVLQLFNSNVCGKVQEAPLSLRSYLISNPPYGLSYTPSYLLKPSSPYQRMVLPSDFTYDPGGPPMCPNDPHTLDRERRYIEMLTKHLKANDSSRTVVMLQIDNEFYYQQWVRERPHNARRVRCHCPWCEREYDQAKYETPEEFMFRSFAAYVDVLTRAAKQVHDIPLYVNSPWWDPYIVEIFLNDAPALDIVGIDGVHDPREPNWLSRSQIGRNIPFAAECPTENPLTRYNLDVLPYYTIVGQQGIGNLLWECYAPFSLVGDPPAMRKYGRALYPLRNAMAPIARARGTERFVGWYALREFTEIIARDEHGNMEPAPESASTSVVKSTSIFVREGNTNRIVPDERFRVSVGSYTCKVEDCVAGIILQAETGELILAIPAGRLLLEGGHSLIAEEGYFDGDQWRATGPFPVQREDSDLSVQVDEPKVIRLAFRDPR